MNAHTKELKCINIARFNRRDLAARALEKLASQPAGFGAYLKTLRLFRYGFGSRIDAIRSILTLPLSLFAYLKAPWGFREFHRTLQAKCAELEFAVTETNRPTREADAPEEKRLLPLWKLHGITTDECRPEDKFLTLNAWVDTLYGPGTARQIRLANRFARNMKRARDTESVTRHVAVREFISQISRELPPYKREFHDISVLIPMDTSPDTASEVSSTANSATEIPEKQKAATLLFGSSEPKPPRPPEPHSMSNQGAAGEDDAFVTVHTLHPDHGYRASRLRLDVDVDSHQFQRFCDRNHEAYGVFTFEGQNQKLQLLGKEAWLKVGDQLRELEQGVHDSNH